MEPLLILGSRELSSGTSTSPRELLMASLLALLQPKALGLAFLLLRWGHAAGGH